MILFVGQFRCSFGNFRLCAVLARSDIKVARWHPTWLRSKFYIILSGFPTPHPAPPRHPSPTLQPVLSFSRPRREGGGGGGRQNTSHSEGPRQGSAGLRHGKSCSSSHTHTRIGDDSRRAVARVGSSRSAQCYPICELWLDVSSQICSL